MSRIIEETNITRVLEAVAPTTTINWNPLDNSGTVVFQVQDMLTENGVYKGLQPNQALGTGGLGPYVQISIADLLARTVTVTLPDASTMDIPGGILMLTVKKLFDDLYSERITAMNSPPVEDPPVEDPPP